LFVLATALETAGIFVILVGFGMWVLQDVNFDMLKLS